MGSQIGALFGGLWGDPGQNFVNLQGGPDAVFGQKPQVADFTPTNLSDETGKAVDANTANYDSISALLNKIIPGFSDILQQGSSNTLSELQGQLPADVQAQVQRSSAFQSLMGGFSGTGMAKGLTARDLGRTSLDLTTMGNNSAQVWSKLAEEAYSPFTVSTAEQAGTTAANNAGAQANQQFKYNVAAAPDPGAAGIFNVDAALGQQMLSFGMAAAGGGIGGGGGGYNAGVGGQNASLQLVGGSGNSSAYQYNPSTGQYAQVPQATAVGAWSDRRLKENIRQVGVSPKGFKIHRFNYKGGSTLFEGVIADEVSKIAPEAVYEGGDGFRRVNYNLTDVSFRTVEPELFDKAA